MKRAVSVGLLTGMMALAGVARADGGADSLAFSSAVPAAVKAQMLADLQFAGTLQGRQATPIFQQIFGGTYMGSTIVVFFTTRIQSVGMDDCGGGSTPMACVNSSLDPHQIFLTNNFTTVDVPQVDRIALMIHESRHSETENYGWPHMKCPVPFIGPDGKDVVGIVSHAKMEGIDACDVTAYGAYAVQAEFLKNTQLYCDNCTDKMKLDAQIYGDDTVNRIINAKSNQKLRQDLGLAALTNSPTNTP